MSCCVKIAVKNVPFGTPSEFLYNDELYFDYSDNLSINEAAQELNEIGSLKESGVLPSFLPKTQKNIFIVSKFATKPNIDNAVISVRIWADGQQLAENVLQVVGSDCDNYTIDLQSENWVAKAKRTKLCEIDGYSPYLYSESSVDVYSLIEQDGVNGSGIQSNGVVFPDANYGGWHKVNGTQFEKTFLDHRPWFYLRRLMRNALCYCGVNFACPFLDTTIGRNTVVYFSGGKKWDKGSQGDPTYYPSNLELPACGKYAFKAINTAAQVFSGAGTEPHVSGEIILFQNDSTDGGYDTGAPLTHSNPTLFGGSNGFWDTTSSKIFYTRGVWDYNAELFLTSDIDVTVYIQIEFYASVGNFPNSNMRSYFLKAGVATKVNFQAKGVIQTSPTLGYVLTLGKSSVAANVTVAVGSSLEGKAQSVMMSNKLQTSSNSPLTMVIDQQISGTIVFPQSYIHEDITIMDLIEGLAHVIGAKVDYDKNTNTIALLSDFDTFITGDFMKGFYSSGLPEFDLSRKELCCTKKSEVQRLEPPCSVIYGFRNTTDAYIDDLSDTEPFRRTVNLKPKFPSCDGNTEENLNPLFEPTLEREATEIKPSAPFLPAVIPVLLDNTAGELSLNIGARIAVYYGGVNQKPTPTTVRQVKRWWGGTSNDYSLIYYASQAPSITFNEIFPAKFLNGKRPLLSYGENPDSMYTFHRKELLAEVLGRRITLDIAINGWPDWKDLSFRRTYTLEDNGMPRRFFLAEKQRNVCDRTATITLIERENKLCLCPYPCDGDVVMQEISKHEKTLDAGSYTYQINYFRLNGVDILPAPYVYVLTVNAASFFPLAVGQYFKSDVDALNVFFQQFAPQIKLSYADTYPRMNIEFPACYAFEMEIVDTPNHLGDGIRLTQNGITHITFNGGTTWLAVGDPSIGTSIAEKLQPPSDIGYFNICNGTI